MFFRVLYVQPTVSTAPLPSTQGHPRWKLHWAYPRRPGVVSCTTRTTYCILWKKNNDKKLAQTGARWRKARRLAQGAQDKTWGAQDAQDTSYLGRLRRKVAQGRTLGAQGKTMNTCRKSPTNKPLCPTRISFGFTAVSYSRASKRCRTALASSALQPCLTAGPQSPGIQS